MVKYLKVGSMELFLVGAIAASVLITALFGVVCVRYTRIFFGILTLALSQVLWSLAFKFFWVTGGTDGLRVPTPTLLGVITGKGDKIAFLATAYYYYVLGVFVICAAVMWVIVSSPFGRALQAIRDNEVRAEFVGIQIRQYRWVAFLVSGVFTGLAGALWVPLNGLTTPDILYWQFSGEIVNLISGLLRADAGQIIFRGQDVTAQTVYERIAAGIARSFQLVNLFDQLSALDNVALAIFSRQGKTRTLWTLAEADRPVWQEAMEILHLFRMEAKARVLAGGLAQGERKLLDVAIAYALKP